MPRHAQKITVELTLSKISCPGVWLRSNNELYLSICLFGKYQRTSLAEPVFPVVFMEKFRYDKIFYTAIDPAEVSEMLEDEDVLIELVQLAPEAPEGAVLLASFQRNVRDFLYPYPQLLPAYGSCDREVLMERSWCFPGIAPKIEFGSHAKIREVKVPKHLRRSAEQEYYSMSRPVKSSIARGGGSPTPRTFIYPDSDEETKGYQEPTVASITRSRSLSPSQRASLRNRPPFLVKRVDETLIHRVPGSKDKRKRRTQSAAAVETSSYSPRTSSPNRNRLCDKITQSVAEPDYYSDEESDIEYLGSYRRRQTRSMPETVLPVRRPVSPVELRRSLRERFLEHEAELEGWRRHRIERAERALAESLASSYRTRSVLSYDSIDELADEFDRSRLFGY